MLIVNYFVVILQGYLLKFIARKQVDILTGLLQKNLVEKVYLLK